MKTIAMILEPILHEPASVLKHYRFYERQKRLDEKWMDKYNEVESEEVSQEYLNAMLDNGCWASGQVTFQIAEKA